VLFSVALEGDRDLVLLNEDGREERRLTLSDLTLRQFSAEDVAGDLKTSLAYDMKDQQGSEDTRL
jgi:hypothetical protein